MKGVRSRWRAVRQMVCCVVLLATTGWAAADGARQPEHANAAPAHEDGNALATYALTGHDIECLQAQRACTSAASEQASRAPVDMRPCLITTSLSPVGDTPRSQASEIPACYFEFFKELQDVDYAAPELLWQALKARVSLAGSNNLQRKKNVALLERDQVTRVDAALRQKLAAESSALALLEGLEGRNFASTEDLEKALDRQFIALAERFEQYRPLLLAQARKLHRVETVGSVPWHTTSCRCTQELAGEVYGFMPFWLAGDSHEVDLAVQTRLGYYAVGFDDRGETTRDAGWRGLDEGFIRQLRARGGKLDMVVSRNDWA